MLELIIRAIFGCSKLWWVSSILPGTEAPNGVHWGLSDALAFELQEMGKGSQGMATSE